MAKAKKEIKLNIDHDNSFDEILLDQQMNRKKDGIQRFAYRVRD